ncbi:MAG: hypothetical protein ACJ79G_24885 [Myxococcales bacterium]
MSFWQFLNQWWNLPYLVALGLVGVFFVLQLFGFAAHAFAGDQEIDLDGDGVPDHDVDTEHDFDSEHEAFSIGAFLGVGRVPFLVVWLTLFIFAGFTGLFLNRVLLGAAGVYRGWFFPLSVAGALGTGVVAVRFAARLVAKLVDVGGRGASARKDLRGRIGVVASATLDAQFGEIRVRDARGEELIVHGRLDGTEKVLERGAQVVLVDLQDEGVFTVTSIGQ